MSKIIAIFFLVFSINLYADERNCVVRAIENQFENKVTVELDSIKRRSLSFLLNDYDFEGTVFLKDGSEIYAKGKARVNLDTCELWRQKKTVMGMRIIVFYDEKEQLLAILEGEMII